MTRVWPRKKLGVVVTANRFQDPDLTVAVIVTKARKIIDGEPEHEIDPSTITITREPLIDSSTQISVADARCATGVLLPRGAFERWRFTAMTRPVINGVTHDIAPDARDLRIPTYHTPGFGDYAAFTNIRPEEI